VRPPACERVLGALPEVPAARRAAMAALPRTRETHAALLAGLPGLDGVEVVPAPAAIPELGRRARVLAWNAERGRRLEDAAAWLAATRADVLLLSELDHGMARSGQRHVARELAARLGCACAFAVEFLELGLGSAAERARLAPGERNAVGHHGGAILARAPLERPALVRLETAGDWFVAGGPEGDTSGRDEPRIGGRIAVLGQLRLGGTAVSFASVHLESHAEPRVRAAQLEGLIDALDAYGPGAPAVIGGDLNTLSLGLAELADPERCAAALRADPDRWRRPERHEPLFAVARAAGFEWRSCNVLGEPTHRHPAPAGSARGQLKLDWLLCRGLEAEAPAVRAAVDPEGAALSDHEAVEAVVVVPSA
jgi:endonuclease/exonuclease/phosphatase family metal-dependent hydrolase